MCGEDDAAAGMSRQTSYQCTRILPVSLPSAMKLTQGSKWLAGMSGHTRAWLEVLLAVSLYQTSPEVC